MVQEKKALLMQQEKEVRSLSQPIKIAILDPQTLTTRIMGMLMTLKVKTLRSLTAFPSASFL